MNHQVGSGGVGFIWSTSEGSHEEEWRHSVAPIPPAKLLEIMHTSNNELEVVQQDGNLPPSGELERDSVTANSNDYDDDDVDVKDDYEVFENEVFGYRHTVL